MRVIYFLPAKAMRTPHRASRATRPVELQMECRRRLQLAMPVQVTWKRTFAAMPQVLKDMAREILWVNGELMDVSAHQAEADDVGCGPALHRALLRPPALGSDAIRALTSDAERCLMVERLLRGACRTDNGGLVWDLVVGALDDLYCVMGPERCVRLLAGSDDLDPIEITAGRQRDAPSAQWGSVRTKQTFELCNACAPNGKACFLRCTLTVRSIYSFDPSAEGTWVDIDVVDCGHPVVVERPLTPSKPPPATSRKNAFLRELRKKLGRTPWRRRGVGAMRVGTTPKLTPGARGTADDAISSSPRARPATGGRRRNKMKKTARKAMRRISKSARKSARKMRRRANNLVRLRSSTPGPHAMLERSASLPISSLAEEPELLPRFSSAPASEKRRSARRRRVSGARAAAGAETRGGAARAASPLAVAATPIATPQRSLRRRVAASENSARAIHLFAGVTPLDGTPRGGALGASSAIGGTPLGERSQRAAWASARRRERVGSAVRGAPRASASALHRGEGQRNDVAHALFGAFAAAWRSRCHSDSFGAHSLRSLCTPLLLAALFSRFLFPRTSPRALRRRVRDSRRDRRFSHCAVADSAAPPAQLAPAQLVARRARVIINTRPGSF